MARGGAGTTSTRPHQPGENTPITQVQMGSSSRMWELLDWQSKHSAGSARRSAVQPCFLPSSVSPFLTCTGQTSTSCSDSVPTSSVPASISPLSPLPSNLLAPSLHTFQKKSRTRLSQDSSQNVPVCLPRGPNI